MDARQLVETNVELIDRLVARACRRAGIASSDVADTASTVKLALVENDYAILRRWEGRSSLATYLTIIIQRLLADQRERTHGRWRPSPEAQRLGPRAVLVEDLVHRQKRTIEEAVPLVRAVDASITRQEISAIADRLPHRSARPREVPFPEENEVPIAAADRADAAVLDGELRDISRRAGKLLRETIAAWPAEDRLLVRLRFESALTISDAARMMNVPQRPLYRRLEALLARLRDVLVKAGIEPRTARELLEASGRIEMDFGSAWKSSETLRTNEDRGHGSPEERTQ
jgi:DNA-directed RNA polymerase specialized sigma24 family protein